MKTEISWENISRDELIKHRAVEGLCDSQIASLYNTTAGKVRYKRKKFKITEALIFFEKFKYENKELFDNLNAEAKGRLFGNIDAFSKMITSYAFRSCEYLEDIHSNGKSITDSDMKQLNKYIVNRISELLLMTIRNDWLKIELILKAKTMSVSEWDECEPNIEEIDDYFYSEFAPTHIADRERKRLYEASLAVKE